MQEFSGCNRLPSRTADNTWKDLLYIILDTGQDVSPRGMPVMEILAAQTCVDMRYPIVTIPERNLGYKFMPAEAAWILSGDNRVETIEPYSKKIREFSDDGYFFAGAYGPMVRDQLGHVCSKLLADQHSRQAVLTIWRPNIRDTRDVPCTVSVQWVIRDGYLHCIDTMRSSDAWLGWPYDVFNFSMLSGYIAQLIFHMGGPMLKLGNLTLQAGSQHLYERNWEGAERCIADMSKPVKPKYQPFDPFEFSEPQDLIDHLYRVARREPMSYNDPHWLREVYDEPPFA